MLTAVLRDAVGSVRTASSAGARLTPSSTAGRSDRQPWRSRETQSEFKNRRKSRSRRGNEADRRRAEAALFRLRLWLRRDRVVAKRRRRRDAKAEVFFAPKSASLGFVQKQVPDRKRISTKAPLTLTLS